MEMESGSGWILVVDDNEGVRAMLAAMMILLGFKVAQACDGAEALNLFSERHFDLILTDLQMPVMDGWNLASRVKARSPETPVILVTGSPREGVEKRLKESPVDRVLFKPFRVEDLLDTVRPWIGSQISFPAEDAERRDS